MKVKYFAVTIPVLLLMLSQIGYAALDVSVQVGTSEIHPTQSQAITVTSNERGAGILFVLQPPSEEAPWADFLNDHPGLKTLFNQLPSSIKSEIVDAVGNKTVSYALVSFGQGGGSEVFVFPYNFTGVNGEPNTLMQGTYKVMFAYLSWEITGGEGCRLFEKDFACTSFFVVPEVPLGSVVSLLAMLAAFPALKYRKHIRLHKKA